MQKKRAQNNVVKCSLQIAFKRNVYKYCRSFIFIVKPILYEQNLRKLTCRNSFDSDQYLILCCIQISLAAFTTRLQKLVIDEK